MIYVIRVDYYNRVSQKPFSIIKIGYCDDSRGDERLYDYRTENPYKKVLYTIYGATRKHESLLHKKFKHLLNTGREWFNESDEIYEYFDTHKDLDSLKDLFYSGGKKYEVVVVNHLLESIKYKLDNNIAENIRKAIKDDDFWSCLSEYYIRSFNTKCTFSNRMDILVNIIKFHLRDNVDYDYLIQDIPMQYKIYFENLDFKFIERYNNRKDILDRELERNKLIDESNNKFFDKDFIKEEILIPKEFNLIMTYYDRISEEDNLENIVLDRLLLGDKYTDNQLCWFFKEIYKRLGISKIPKASDIEQWFEVKRVAFPDIDGKRVEGFELLNRK